MPYCSITWCKKKSQISNYSYDGVTFHRFPRSPKRKEKWIDKTGRPDTWFPSIHSTICSTHFEESCFYQHGNTRRLFDTAIPTLNLPALVSNIEQADIDVKTEPKDDNDEIPKRKKIVQVVKPLRGRPKKHAKQEIVSITKVGGLQPIAPKLSPAVISTLQQIAPTLCPGTLVPINIKPMLNHPIIPNLNQATLTNSIQPMSQTNIKSVSSQPVIRVLDTSAKEPPSENKKFMQVFVHSTPKQTVTKPQETDNIKQEDNAVNKETVTKPQETENIKQVDDAVFRERVLKRKIEHLKSALENKCKDVKALQDKNRLLERKVVSLKKIVESLVKVKR